MFNDASEYSQSINNAVQRQSSVANARELMKVVLKEEQKHLLK